jgi:hypothetical protein
MLPSVSAHTDPVRAIARRFLQTLAAESRQHDNPEPLPARLARAAAVLPIEGVGLLLHKQPDRWTPLGASNETVALVQRLHDTVSDSPCQVAAETKSPVIATEELLTQRWPLFADLLLRQTPVRSMLVMPLSGRLHGRAFAVFCSATPAGVTAIPMIELCVVTGLLSHHLEATDDRAPWPQALASNTSTAPHPDPDTYQG